MTTALRERDVVGSTPGIFTLKQLYEAVQAAGPAVTSRADGDDVVHGAHDTRWKRRVRGALQTLKRDGHARRIGDRMWVIDGTPQAPPWRDEWAERRGERHVDLARRGREIEAIAGVLATLDPTASRAGPVSS